MRRNSEAGFTLIELIVAMTITAILSGMVAMFARWPIQTYLDVSNRAVLADTADTALRRISRDIRQALPNSVRVTTGTCSGGSGTCYFVEFIPIKAGGRYRVKTNSSGGGNPLSLSATGNQTFDVIGAPLCPSSAECTISAGDSLVYCNSTYAQNNATDAYRNPGATPAANRRLLSSTGTNLSSLSFTGTSQPLSASQGGDSCTPDHHRFYVVGGAVSYECPSTANAAVSTLKRHACYAIQATQPTAFPGPAAQTGCAGVQSSILASGVDHCTVRRSTDNTMLAIDLTLTSNGESAHLLHQIDLYNAP